MGMINMPEIVTGVTGVSVTPSVTGRDSVTGVTPYVSEITNPIGNGGRVLESFHRDTLTARAKRYGAYVQACVAVTGVSWVFGVRFFALPDMSLGRTR